MGCKKQAQFMNSASKYSIPRWVIGILAAAFGHGIAVSQEQLDNYQLNLEQAHHVTDRELQQARRMFREADQR